MILDAGLAVLIVFGISILTLVWSIKRKDGLYYIREHDKILALFQHFCTVAFDLVYKDQIMSYDASDFALTGDHLESARRNHIRLALELMGKNNKTIFIKFYGTETALIANIIMDFNSRIENNEIANFIRKQQAEL